MAFLSAPFMVIQIGLMILGVPMVGLIPLGMEISMMVILLFGKVPLKEKEKANPRASLVSLLLILEKESFSPVHLMMARAKALESRFISITPTILRQ